MLRRDPAPADQPRGLEPHHPHSAEKETYAVNENTNTANEEPGFFGKLVQDDGVQRATAGIVVAIIVAGTKEMLFGRK